MKLDPEERAALVELCASKTLCPIAHNAIWRLLSLEIDHKFDGDGVCHCGVSHAMWFADPENNEHRRMAAIIEQGVAAIIEQGGS